MVYPGVLAVSSSFSVSNGHCDVLIMFGYRPAKGCAKPCKYEDLAKVTRCDSFWYIVYIVRYWSTLCILHYFTYHVLYRFPILLDLIMSLIALWMSFAVVIEFSRLESRSHWHLELHQSMHWTFPGSDGSDGTECWGCPAQGSLNVFACMAPLEASMKVYSLDRLEPGSCNAAFIAICSPKSFMRWLNHVES